MEAFEIALVSVFAMLLLIYFGMHISVTLALISFVGAWVIKGNAAIAFSLLLIAAEKTVNNFVFAVIPLFVLMGFLVAAAGMGRDAYDIGQIMLRKVRGGLGMATVVANAIFASITGASVASASVFSKVAVPEMMRHGYFGRFAVGTVAGSSVLGMLIPPSVLLIIYALIAEESVGDLFIAGIGPGILLTIAFCGLIYIMATFFPRTVQAAREASTRPAKRSRRRRSAPAISGARRCRSRRWCCWCWAGSMAASSPRSRRAPRARCWR